MKKEKSKMVLEWLSVLITIALIFNLYVDYKHSECLLKVEETMVTKTISLDRELYLAESNFMYLYTTLNIKNYTNFKYSITNGTCDMTINTELPKECTNSFLKWPLNVLEKIHDLEKEIRDKRAECNIWRTLIKISLFFALVVCVVSLRWSVYKPCKT